MFENFVRVAQTIPVYVWSAMRHGRNSLLHIYVFFNILSSTVVFSLQFGRIYVARIAPCPGMWCEMRKKISA